MIVFESVFWKNFLSTGSQGSKVNLNNHGTTLIVGKNGEGKSTILDALCFALFNKPFRNVNKNQLINSINGKQCEAEVEFSIGPNAYKVKRTIKPNTFEIYCNDELVNQDAALKDYQKVLEQQILKLNYKTFTQVVILGSASFVPFMQLPGGQRREVIEDILDIRVFSTMNTILKDKIIETKEELKDKEIKLNSIKDKATAQQRIIESLVNTKDENVKGITEKIEANNNIIKQKSNHITELLSQITELKNSIETKETIIKDIDSCKNNSSKLKQKNSTIDESINFFENNEVCPSCEQGIQHEHKDSIIEKLTINKQEYDVKLTMLDSALDKLTDQLQVMQDISNKITDMNIEVSTENTSVQMLNKLNADMQNEIASLNSNQGNIEQEKSTLKSYASEALELNNDRMEIKKKRNLQDIASSLLRDMVLKLLLLKNTYPL